MICLTGICFSIRIQQMEVLVRCSEILVARASGRVDGNSFCSLLSARSNIPNMSPADGLRAKLMSRYSLSSLMTSTSSEALVPRLRRA